MSVPFLQKRPSGYRYRRKVPADLRAAIGKGEIVIPLGASEAVALRAYPKAHAQAEALITRASKPAPAPLASTPLELFRTAHMQSRQMGFDASWSAPDSPNDQEGIGRSETIDAILASYRKDEDGDPIAVSASDMALIRALGSGVLDKPPAPTIQDAKQLYLKDAVKDNEKRKQQLEHIFSLISQVIKLDRPVTSLRRTDAREVRDHMLDGRSPASAERYLNIVRAVINYSIKEMDLAGVQNPFMGLSTGTKETAEPDRRKRDVFSPDELLKINARVLSGARADLALIWTLLQYTGCRLAEITGLRVEDVHLNHSVPHIAIEWHEKRRIKTLSSRRLVPLLGTEALVAAQRALDETAEGNALFPAYFREGGPDSASAALGKHVRACVKNPKLTTYSLRHRMADLMDLAKVSLADRELVMGHTSGRTSETYGSEGVRLERARSALAMALGAPETEVSSQ